jgi:hypothetical protein
MATVAVAVRVRALPSIVAVPRTSMVEGLGVSAEVVRVRSAEAFGPRAGAEKLALTPVGRLPRPRVVRPVKPPVVTVLTFKLMLVPAMAVRVAGSTVRVKS